MLPKVLSFVDIETSGSSPVGDRIIEIAIIRVEDGKAVTTFDTLVNPESPIHPFTTQLTGITSEDVETAPTFSEISDEIYEILEGAVFVAHNVRFDYGFVRNELSRMGHSFTAKQLCTVKLARQLYPGYRRYSLDSIIERHCITCNARHRALGDTEVIYHFFQKALEEHGEEKMAQSISKVMKRPSVPITISQNVLDNVPESPGVYIFRDAQNMPLYVGKSVNLRNRVMSHFSSDHLTTTDAKLAREASGIEIVQTAGELGALLKEAAMVKELQPLYNKQLRRMRKIIVAIEGEVDGYKTIQISELDQLDLDDIEKVIGVFKSFKQAREFVRNLGKENNLCDKYLGLEKTKGSCFAYQLNSCKGACVGEESTLKYNLRFVQAISKYKVKSWPFSGPIIIKESGENGEEGYIVDKWCLVGLANGHVPSKDEFDYSFDYDTYKILRRFLLPKSGKPTVHVYGFTYPQTHV